MAAHNAHMKQMLDTLKAEGIAENTLVVWISDNGPMYAFYPNSGYSWLKGGKGEITEGGVRVPAMAWWPGMIAPNQDPVDILHLTDLFTTAARLGGALGNIPNDRVTDGVGVKTMVGATRCSITVEGSLAQSAMRTSRSISRKATAGCRAWISTT
jgi:arylsulfatase